LADRSSEGADVGVRLERIADLQRGHAPGERVAEGLEPGAMHEEALRGDAALAAVEGARRHRRASYRLRIRVSENEIQGHYYNYRLSQPFGVNSWYCVATGNIDGDAFPDVITAQNIN